MVDNGWKKIDNGWKWLIMVDNGWKWLIMAENGWKWLEIIDNGWKWGMIWSEHWTPLEATRKPSIRNFMLSLVLMLVYYCIPRNEVSGILCFRPCRRRRRRLRRSPFVSSLLLCNHKANSFHILHSHQTLSKDEPSEKFPSPFAYLGSHLGFLTKIDNAVEKLINYGINSK